MSEPRPLPEPWTPVALDHVQLAMPAGREGDARAFYAGLLGLAEVPKPAPLAARGGAWFASGGLELHLGVDPAFAPARKAHPGLRLADAEGLERLAGRLRAAGIEPEHDAGLPGFRRFYAADPFGNRLELLAPEPSVPAAVEPPPGRRTRTGRGDPNR